jgi:micrococcal nuclease
VGGTDAGLTLIEDGFAIARYDSRDGYGRHTREDADVRTSSVGQTAPTVGSAAGGTTSAGVLKSPAARSQARLSPACR